MGAQNTALPDPTAERYVDNYAPPTGGAYVAVNEAMLNPREFGAIGDGSTDDSLAINRATSVAAAAVADGYRAAGVLIAGRFAVAAPISLPSGVTIEGTGKDDRLIGLTDGQPVIASAAYLAGGAPTPGGQARVAKLNIYPAAGPGSHGIVLLDYSSKIADVDVHSPGGDGIKLVHQNSAGTPVGSTLVENRIDDCRVYQAVGTPFALGADDNQKITDGFLRDCIAVGTATSPDIIAIGQASGWLIEGNHLYGFTAGNALRARNGYKTRIGGIYSEVGPATGGVYLQAVQQAVSVDDVAVSLSDVVDGTAVYLDRSAAFANPRVSIDNITAVQVYARKSWAVRVADAAIVAAVGSVHRDGPQRAYVCDTNATGIVRLAQVLASAKWGGSGAQSITAVIALPSFVCRSGMVMISGFQFSDGGHLAEYVGHWSVSSKDNSVPNPWAVNLTTVVAPVGFTVPPAAAITSPAAANQAEGTLVITFTASDAGNSNGACTITMFGA